MVQSITFFSEMGFYILFQNVVNPRLEPQADLKLMLILLTLLNASIVSMRTSYFKIHIEIMSRLKSQVFHFQKHHWVQEYVLVVEYLPDTHKAWVPY